jgi:hypothetical protein
VVLSVFTLVSTSKGYALNHHAVGWYNTVIPGGGRYLLGQKDQAYFEATYEIVPTVVGFYLSDKRNMSLDGFRADLPTSLGRRYTRSSADLTRPLMGNLLLEWGIKAHMVNVFRSYREKAQQEGVTSDIDQSDVDDLFMSPFQKKYMFNPWVYVPILGVLAYAAIDYGSSSQAPDAVDRLTPESNVLHDFHYGVWQPIGSGAPEEMFFRGFLQRELHELVPSPFFSIPLQALAFAYSHEPGDGRVTAFVAGSLLGLMAHLNNMDLHKGIAVHFWSEFIFGVESILLSHDNQGSSYPSGFSIQINF